MIIGVPRKRFWFAAIIGLTIFLYTLKQADLKRLLANIQEINAFWGIAALVSSMLSYTFIAAVLHRLLRGMGHRLPFTASLRISLLSCTLNYLMAIGGLSGMAAKVYLLAREKVPPSNTLSISMVHGFLTNTVAVMFIYLGFFFLYSQYKMSSREVEVGVFILLVAFVLTWTTIQIIIHENFRKKLWELSMRLAMTLSRKLHNPRWLHPERADTFFRNFNDSMNLLVSNARILLKPAAYAVMDWILMFLCLKCSFLAANYPVDHRSLLVGFSIGIFASLFSVTPVSIGVMEGSMAGSFYLMGLDYETSLLATLIYRFSYYFLPILISIGFFKHLIPTSADDVDIDGDRGEQR